MKHLQRLFCLCAVLNTLCLLVQADTMTVDKQIVNSARQPEAFNFFHLMPEGDVQLTVEYDLLLSMEEYRQLHRGKEEPSSTRRQKRKAARRMFLRWEKCIVYYEIEDSLDPATGRLIREAMNDWEKYTCLIFKENSTSPRRIQFKNGEGCKSKLGMQMKPQPLLLDRGCRTKGVVTHEIGHAIGFFHEHMRPDRDNYISVNFDVISDRYKADYKKYSTDIINTYDLPYDYTSLMHYGNTLPDSIRTLDPDFQNSIGQREGLSFHDIALANAMYDCAKMVCGSRAKMTCPGGGFRMSKRLNGERPCQCWCDTGDINDPLVLCHKRTKIPPKPMPVTTPKPPPPKPMGCFDVHNDCAQLKKEGKCMSSMELMMDFCSKTCDFCGKGKGMCMDHEKNCPIAAGAGLCKDPDFEEFMTDMCPGSCGLCEKPPDPCQIQKEMMGEDFSDNPGNAGGTTAWSRAGFGATLLVWVGAVTLLP